MTNTSKARLLVWALAVTLVGALQAAPPSNRGAVRMSPRHRMLPEEGEIRRAKAILEGRSGSNLDGIVLLTEKNGQVTLTIAFENATPGMHAVHIHETGDCSAPDASSAGPHWNPTGEAHGKWQVPPFHRGDIGNLEVGEDGKVAFDITTPLWSLGGPPETNLLGKSVVVHAQADDFTTQPTGNSGARIGCGVIRPE